MKGIMRSLWGGALGVVVLGFWCVGCSSAVQLTTGGGSTTDPTSDDGTDLAQQMEVPFSSGASGVEPSDLTISFAVPVNPDTVTADTIALTESGSSEPVPIALSVSDDGMTIALRPLRSRALQEYELTVRAGISSVDGTAMTREATLISYTSAANEASLQAVPDQYADAVLSQGVNAYVVNATTIQNGVEAILSDLTATQASQYTVSAQPITSAANLTKSSMLAVSRMIEAPDIVRDKAILYRSNEALLQIQPRDAYRLADTSEEYALGDMNLDRIAELAVVEVGTGIAGDAYLDIFLSPAQAASVTANEADVSMHFFSANQLHVVRGVLSRDFKNSLVVSGRLVTEARDVIRIYFARSGQNFSSPDATITTTGYAIDDVTVADMNGDGFDDLVVTAVVGMLDYTSLLMLPGPITPGEHALSEATSILRNGGQYNLGSNVIVADIDGDLRADVISDGYTVAATGGNVAIYYGAATLSERSMETPDTVITAPATDCVGAGLRIIGDVNNDGYQDIAIRTGIDGNANGIIDAIDDRRENVIFTNIERSANLPMTSISRSRVRVLVPIM